jgi:predicted acyl esterase
VGGVAQQFDDGEDGALDREEFEKWVRHMQAHKKKHKKKRRTEKKNQDKERKNKDKEKKKKRRKDNNNSKAEEDEEYAPPSPQFNHPSFLHSQHCMSVYAVIQFEARRK